MQRNPWRQAVPWQVLILGKLILSRLPLDYRRWRQLKLFKHGMMHDPEYAYKVVTGHFSKFTKASQKGVAGTVVLELGPGDSLCSAMIAHAMGVAQVYLVDVGDFACKDMQPYMRMAAKLKQEGFNYRLSAASVPEWLNAGGITYMNAGLKSLQLIPSNSVDFIWSQAVLEHIRKSEIGGFFRECRRILKSDGISSHCIDLRDHLGGKLNHLRFSSRIWESDFMAQSGFYTNRIRCTEMLKLFAAAGFNVESAVVEQWDKPPVARHNLSVEFQSVSDADLCVSIFDVILRPI